MSSPLLIYDGDCGFCRYTVRYAARLTRGRVRYAPYQSAGDRFPELSEADFRAAIWLIEGEGEADERRRRGADAAFRSLALAGGGYRLWHWLYRWLPGFALLTEALYGLVARHRGACLKLSQWLVGRELHPTRFELTAWLFLRVLGLLYLAAFISMAVQVTGLIGEQGVLPVGLYLERAHEQLGSAAYWRLPTVFWLGHSDVALLAVCWGGAGLALLLTVGVAWRWLLAGLVVLYLSLVSAGQVFMQYQWDMLLLEAGFLAIFVPRGTLGVGWLFRWLAFRFMLMAGAAKLLSGDSAWQSWQALAYHFQTQPLPTPLAWYAHHSPEWLLTGLTGATLMIELVVPFFVFLPRRLRQLAAASFAAMEIAILVTGNYNWFNLLTLALCLFLVDDVALARVLPRRLTRWLLRHHRRARSPATWRRVGVGVVGAAVLVISGAQVLRMFTDVNLPQSVRAGLQAAAPLRVVNTYGLFAVMTTKRDEIILQGSRNGEDWHAYRFPYKPGELDRAPPWSVPHQPRLDWQMWFAALQNYRQNPWLVNLAVRLLQGRQEVLALLRHNPFPDEPPRYIRAVVHEYRFTDPGDSPGDQWWTRGSQRIYMPPIGIQR